MTAHRQPDSHLFTLRLWKEAASGVVFRCKVKHLASGETHHFAGWEALQAFLAAKLQELEGDPDLPSQEGGEV